MRIVIAEDDPRYVRLLRQFLTDFSRETGQSFQITCYDNGEDLVEHYRPEYDIIFLDIEMPFMDGMTAAAHIRQMDNKVVLIFITNLAQYAIQGYKVNALDYIVKPLNYASFVLHLERAISFLCRRQDNYISLAIKGGVVRLDVESIYFIEVQKNQLLIHTKKEVYTASVTLQKIEKALEGQSFFRCNKSYLVNLAQVEAFREGCAVVHGEHILVSRSRKGAFLDALNQYIGEVLR